MRNTWLLILSIVIVIVAILISKIYDLKEIENNISKFNSSYEEYLDKEIYGRDIASIINKAIDENNKKNLTKDEENYININIKIIDLEKETVIEMEKFYNGGIAQFVDMYGDINFKCTDVKYASNNKVNYLLFEQISK